MLRNELEEDVEHDLDRVAGGERSVGDVPESDVECWWVDDAEKRGRDVLLSHRIGVVGDREALPEVRVGAQLALDGAVMDWCKKRSAW